MANTIPCPNPVCTHDFRLTEVQSAAQLLCPKCGFRMQGRAAPSKPAQAAPPAKLPAPPAAGKPAPAPGAKPVGPPTAVPKPPASTKPTTAQPPTPSGKPKPPVAQPKPAPPAAAAAIPPMALPLPAQPKSASPVAAGTPPMALPLPAQPASPMAVGSPPLASPVAATGQPPTATPVNGEESMTDGTFFNPEVDAGTAQTLVRTGTAKKKFNWLRLLIIFFAIGFAACVVIAAIGTIIMLFPDAGGMFAKTEADMTIGNIRNTKNEIEKIYKLVLPKKEWIVDSEIASRFGAHSAYQSNVYDFWFALVVKDYDKHKPRDAEMLRMAVDKLEGHFGDALELAAKAESVKFGAVPAQKLPFRGEYKSAKWLGECYLFFNNGIAYWLFTASPDGNVIEHFAEDLPDKHLFVLSERRGWREQPWPTETYPALSGKFDVSAPKDVWKQSKDPKSEDPNGDLLLAGIYRREKDNTKNALLLVFTMEKKDEPIAALKAAREHLEAKAKADNENAKVLFAADIVAGQTEQGTQKDIGNRRGRLIDLKLQINDETHTYYLLAIVRDDDVSYVILCECSWKSRQIWRQDFLDLLGTLQIK